jgi:hypothetical protein
VRVVALVACLAALSVGVMRPSQSLAQLTGSSEGYSFPYGGADGENTGASDHPVGGRHDGDPGPGSSDVLCSRSTG